METLHQEVQDYYGKELATSADLKTNACCTLTAPPEYILEALVKCMMKFKRSITVVV